MSIVVVAAEFSSGFGRLFGVGFDELCLWWYFEAAGHVCYWYGKPGGRCDGKFLEEQERCSASTVSATCYEIGHRLMVVP